ncbi:Uncharacterized protein QTN25_009011 [Entamoeba marina]
MDREVSFTFKTLTGRSYPMTLPLSTTVAQLVTIVTEQIHKGYSVRLICGGKQRENNETLADLDVETNKDIHIVIRLHELGWKLHSDQTSKCILTINNRNYSSFFWEADLSSHLYSTKKWVVLYKKTPADDFFYYLDKCGLNNTEANDFVVSLMKTMKQCKRVCVRMVDVKIINDIAKLIVFGFEKDSSCHCGH